MAAVQFGQSARDGQPEAGPGYAPRLVRVRAVEPLEHQPLVALTDAGAVVADLQADGAVGSSSHREPDAPADAAVFDGVCEQVQCDLLQSASVTVKRAGQRIQIDGHLLATAICQRTDGCERLLDDFAQIEAFAA